MSVSEFRPWSDKAMVDDNAGQPECFGQLEIVFPMGEEGIRTTPPKCMKCSLVKSCIQAAMRSAEGLRLEEERVDRAYEYGLIGRLDCWSKKKLIHQKMEALASKGKSEGKEK
jgi:hypothetical protein